MCLLYSSSSVSINCYKIIHSTPIVFLIADSQMEQGYRSEVQERALVVSLQMFSLILERGVSLLKAQLDSRQEPRLVVGEDLQVLLPAIKVPTPPLPVNMYRAKS